MRYMIVVRATADSEAGVMPQPGVFEAMGKFNEDLIQAGVLIAAEGLHPSKEGARVTFDKGQFIVKDGPFAETKELIAGYWILDVKSKAEALEWVKRIPFEQGEYIDVFRVFEPADFAGVMPDEMIAREEELRAEIAAKQ